MISNKNDKKYMSPMNVPKIQMDQLLNSDERNNNDYFSANKSVFD